MGVDINFVHNGVLCVVAYVQKIPLVLTRLARPRILHEPKHVFLDRNETNDHEQPRSVPFVPVLFEGSQDTSS